MTLSLDALTVRLGGRTVLDNAALMLTPGTLAALVGPNGAGKSSLLRAVAGLVPSRGRLAFEGRDLRTMPARERARLVSLLPQGHEVHWPLPAADIVALGRIPHGAADPARLPPADREAVRRAMARTDTLAYADRPVTALSGGERARVALARVLAVEAPVVLADEPIAALDPRHQMAVMATLKEAARDGRIVVVVTHDLGLACRHADRVVVLREGRVVADAEPGIALADAVLADVFGVRAFRGRHEGEPVLVPWS